MEHEVSDIAFVTVNYNTCQLVENMLSFFDTATLPFTYRVIIVDNASTDGSHEFLSGRTGITYIPAGENLGYGKGINRGIQASESPYICVLNTDVVLNAESLARLWEFMVQKPDVGVVSPVILSRDGSMQGFVFHRALTSVLFNVINKIRSSLIKARVSRATLPVKVQGVLGAFFLIRRSVITGAHLFDEDFFFYYEDTDLAHRLCDAGVICYALPSCSVVHLGGASTSVEGARVFYRSKDIYIRKHYGDVTAWLVARVDRIRLKLKYAKYSILSGMCSSKRVEEKKVYYSAMQSVWAAGRNE